MFDIQEELKKMPDKPGVYIMKDENGSIIYVGKAVILKNRVRQYFQASAVHPPKVQAMVARIKEFEYIVTDSELEALILECNLIKNHRPKFNILLKDDKNYPYIKISMNEAYPKILMTRRVENDGAKYFGPYSNVYVVKETIGLLRKIFPIKTCKRILPRDLGKYRPCLNYDIYQCLGPCSGKVDKEEYRALMKDVCLFLDGKHENIAKKFEEQMLAASENLDYEKAAALRNKLNSLKQISEKQKVLSTAMLDQDVIGLARDATDTCIQVFFIRSGKLIGREHFIFEGVGESETEELLSAFIMQFYDSAAYIPGEIIVQEQAGELEVLESWLSMKRQGKARITVPKKGGKRHLAEMVSRNAAIALEQFREKLSREGTALREGLQGLAGITGLEKIPGRIEAYDISNTGSSEMVASMVVFEDGLSARKEYRRFKIKTIDRQNDYASMQETIYRRFKRAEKEAEQAADPAYANGAASGDGSSLRAKFSRLPDLILLDGGLGHVNAVCQVLDELNIRIPACGMVKDDNHRTRGIVLPGKETDITKNLPVLRLVTAIQDEAHRFALDYNKKLREKRYTVSVLDEIEGIGTKRKKALLKHFGSAAAVRKAGVDDLLAVEGINKTAAEKVYQYFNGERLV
ncbi:MAG: excinuclease ABC subunit UvrC [Ruminiclostridium sp.]|nr:excinuclease ABC subunit UvrC [Ruminiclostridium sp.]